MLWRVQGDDPIMTVVNGVDVLLDPARLYDDDDPEDLEVIKSCKGFLTRPNVDGPERATAAPGEKRTTRRK